jgi:hypothetical protein
VPDPATIALVVAWLRDEHAVDPRAMVRNERGVRNTLARELEDGSWCAAAPARNESASRPCKDCGRETVKQPCVNCLHGWNPPPQRTSQPAQPDRNDPERWVQIKSGALDELLKMAGEWVEYRKIANSADAFVKHAGTCEAASDCNIGPDLEHVPAERIACAECRSWENLVDALVALPSECVAEKPTFAVGDRVVHRTDEGVLGTIIEADPSLGRYRVAWDRGSKRFCYWASELMAPPFEPVTERP